MITHGIDGLSTEPRIYTEIYVNASDFRSADAEAYVDVATGQLHILEGALHAAVELKAWADEEEEDEEESDDEDDDEESDEDEELKDAEWVARSMETVVCQSPGVLLSDSVGVAPSPGPCVRRAGQGVDARHERGRAPSEVR